MSYHPFCVLLAALFLGACATPETHTSTHPPVVFIHGAFGSSAGWIPTIWRFESNGWPRDRLFAVDVPNPRARADDGVPMPGRISAADHAAHLAAEVLRRPGQVRDARRPMARATEAQTHLTAEAPALKGAENVVIPGADHSEVSYGPKAFEHAYRFITGSAPPRKDIVPERVVVLDGKVTGWIGDTPTNQPISGANVEIHEVSAATGERLGAGPVHAGVTEADGSWGPFSGKPDVRYEFVVTAPGHATTHFHRWPCHHALPPLALPSLVALRTPSPGAPARGRPQGSGRCGDAPPTGLPGRRPGCDDSRRQAATGSDPGGPGG
jgi:hypothetical protein